MIEQNSLCYTNSASSELTVNSEDIIQSPDLDSFSLVATTVDNKQTSYDSELPAKARIQQRPLPKPRSSD